MPASAMIEKCVEITRECSIGQMGKGRNKEGANGGGGVQSEGRQRGRAGVTKSLKGFSHQGFAQTHTNRHSEFSIQKSLVLTTISASRGIRADSQSRLFHQDLADRDLVLSKPHSNFSFTCCVHYFAFEQPNITKLIQTLNYLPTVTT